MNILFRGAVVWLVLSCGACVSLSETQRNRAASIAVAARYVVANLRIENAGAPVAFELVGQRREGDVTWIELRAARVPTVSGAMVLNRLLMDMHADQVNIVKAQYDGRSYTTLFSKGDGAKRIP